MNLAKLALDHSRITIIAMLVIVALGLSTYLIYPSAEDPTIKIRSVSVTASFPGMSAERIEDLIAVPLEAAMREIAEIDEITSISKTGSVKLKLEIRDEVSDLDSVFQDIRNKAEDVKKDLPEGTQSLFVNDEEGLTAIATIALWSDGFSLAEMRDVARDTRDLLYSLKGFKKIEILGVQEERVYLEITPTKLAEFGVSPQEIFSALAQQNIIEPGGEIVAGGRTVVLEPSGNLGYATFQPDLIEAAVESAVSNVYQTLAIVLTVVMVFLGLRIGPFVPVLYTFLFGISTRGLTAHRMHTPSKV